jgi:DNA invertase Pin-like site-specific DNA recombinase
MSGRPSPLHNKPRPYRLAIPLDVIPKIDQLKAQGHRQINIAKALGIHYNTIRAVLRRLGAYKDVP